MTSDTIQRPEIYAADHFLTAGELTSADQSVRDTD